jgi:hypothetical protein
VSVSSHYKSLEEFLDDLAKNPKFAFAVNAFAERRNEGWLSVEEVLGRETDVGQILTDLAFKRLDTPWEFSACNLKVRYMFDEDYVDDGRAILLFNLVATRWVHLVWLANQNEIVSKDSEI